MARLRMFGAARDAAGQSSCTLAGADVGTVLDEACAKYGEAFVAVLASSVLWLDGEPVGREHPVGPDDELAVLPPFSGG